MGSVWSVGAGEFVKRVLVIANLFHASPRIPGLVAYLPDFGWQASILTPPLGQDAQNRFGFPPRFLERATIVDVPYAGDIFQMWRRLFKQAGFNTSESLTEQLKERVGVTTKRSMVDLMMTWYQTMFAFPDTERTWKLPALHAATALLAREHFDAILSSSPFPTSHVVAAQLQEQTGLPWVADFRDPWTVNHNYPFQSFRKTIETAFEKRTMKRAESLITVSPGFAKKIESLHGRSVSVITNGFDLSMSESASQVLTGKFTVTYTGTIYTGKQDSHKFLRALSNLFQGGQMEPSEVCVRFYGRKDTWLKQEIYSFGLSHSVTQYPTVPKLEVVARQKESQLLLIFNWEDQEETGVYPLKLFDYLAAKRPILATGGYRNSDVRNILEITRAGRYATSVEEIETVLLSSYREFKEHGMVKYDGCWENVIRYSYVEGARRLSDILVQCMGMTH